jgi:hypothetical protein
MTKPSEGTPSGTTKMELLDANAPLEFERLSVEDAKRASDRSDQIAASKAESASPHGDELLDSTATWFSQLPSSVRPLEVGRHHRRIANKISALWKHHAACVAYVDTLLADRQADQAPLKPEILGELTALRKYRATLHVDGKARSAADLHASTREWIEHLPSGCRPMAIALQFPHIANKLCEIWKRPVMCDQYFNELVIDQRGGRKGFPLEVATEISLLRQYYATLYPDTHGGWKDGDFAR